MQIEGIEGLLRVYTCQLHKEEGQHSCFSFEALVPDGKGAAYLQQVHNPIKAYLTEESGEKRGLCFFRPHYFSKTETGFLCHENLRLRLFLFALIRRT